MTRRAAGPARAPAASSAEGLAGAGAPRAGAVEGVADRPAVAAPALLAAPLPAAPSSITANRSPLFTVAPAATFNSRSTPFTGACTSSVTLSVSRSARFSSRVMLSPEDFRQATSVASATDSGSCGTRISTVMNSSLWAWGLDRWALGIARARGGRRRQRQAGGAAHRLLDGGRAQRGFDQASLLGLVQFGEPGGGSGGCGTTRVVDRADVGMVLQPMTDLIPGTLILRFLLTPHQVGGVGVAREHRLIFVHREGVELLDAHQRYLARALSAA